jgi:hypothetical protein
MSDAAGRDDRARVRHAVSALGALAAAPSDPGRRPAPALTLPGAP